MIYSYSPVEDISDLRSKYVFSRYETLIDGYMEEYRNDDGVLYIRKE